jgi:hypothetical protein
MRVAPRLALKAAPLLALTLALPAAAAGEVKVRDFEIFAADGVTEIFVETSAPPTFQSHSTKDPPTLVVDLIGATGAPDAVEQPGGVIRSMSFADAKGRRGEPVSRMTLRFSREVRYDVTAEGHILRVQILDGTKPSKKGPRVATRDRPNIATDATPVRLAQEDEAGASTDDGSGGDGPKMTYIGFNDREENSRVFLRMNVENAKYEVKKEGDNLMVIEIFNATIPLDNNKNYLDTTFFTSPVKMITPSEVEDDPPMIRVTIEMKENVPYEDKREGREIALYFKK